VEAAAGVSWDALLDDTEVDGSFGTLRTSGETGSEVATTFRLCAFVALRFLAVVWTASEDLVFSRVIIRRCHFLWHLSLEYNRFHCWINHRQSH